MASASVSVAPAQLYGTMTATAAEEDEDRGLYEQLLRLQDTILAGKHAFTLPAAAVEQLKAALIMPEAANTSAYATNEATSAAAKVNRLPGLGAQPSLDPIFLTKSESLVRAEGQLKRQRLERDLQTQTEQRKHPLFPRYGKDPDYEPPSPLAVGEILVAAQQRVAHVPGFKPDKAASVSSFDENDYYSSRAPSEWSSDAGSRNGSDKGADAGAFVADFERIDGARPAESSRTAQKRAAVNTFDLAQAHKDHVRAYNGEEDDLYEPEDEDEEYTPPDAAGFDSARKDATAMDDNSDYEPGEITQDDTVPTPYQAPPPNTAQPFLHVPVIRNHLTHIAAPQPNRVSPLATAKGSNYELELVNGRPEVVQKPKPQQRSIPVPSRVSTASPSNAGGSNKKGRNKKRKRGQETSNRAKKRHDRHAPHSPVSPAQREPYIKDEPVSPPPFAPDVPPYPQQGYRPAAAQVDLVSPGHPPQPRYADESPRSALRYEYAQPATPVPVRVASSAGHRPVQRDTQDLRRVASMHYAQHPVSPAQRIYSPVAPYRAVSTVYTDPQPVQYAAAAQPAEHVRYVEAPAEQRVQYVRTERAVSQPRPQEYQDQYARAPSPAVMAPPPQPAPRRIVVDQYGNRYYASEQTPAMPRASVAPVERQPEPQPSYERAPSRMSYAPAPAVRYEQADAHMAPPPAPAVRQEQPAEYIDANGYRVRQQYSSRAPENVRYAEAPTSPVYQQTPRYETMPPPPAERTSPVYQQVPQYKPMPPPAPPAANERTSPVYQLAPRYDPMPPPPPPHAAYSRDTATSPVYQQVPRAFSVRPQEPPPPQATPGYGRQASVAPVQYVRQHEMAPPPLQPQRRAVSVAPGGHEYGAQLPSQQQQGYGYAPAPQQAVRYIDQYGREVDMQQVRQVSVAPRY